MANEEAVIRLTCPNPSCRKILRVKAHMAGQKVRCPMQNCANVIRVPQPVEVGIPDAIVVADPPAKRPGRSGIPDALVITDPPATPKEKTWPEISAPRPATKSAPPRKPPPPPADDEDDEVQRVEPPRRKPPQQLVEVDEVLEDLDDDSPVDRPRQKKRRKKRRRGGHDSPALRYACKQGAGILFALAAINLVCGGISVAVGSVAAAFLPGIDPTALLIGLIVIVLTYAGLGVWACFRPFFPLLIGLILYGGDGIYTVYSALSSGQFPGFLIGFLVVRVMILTSMVKVLATAWNASSE